MPLYAPDILYALARLGLSDKTPSTALFEALSDAQHYRLISKERLETVRTLEAFFKARRLFGALDLSEEAIRQAYHAKALLLHPDLGPRSPTAEDELKTLNAAWHTIQQTQRHAKAYFKLPEASRHAQEEEARQARAHEAPETPPKPHEKKKNAATDEGFEDPEDKRVPPRAHARRPHGTPPPASPLSRGTFIAASVPRYIRQARLPQLPLQAIIGARRVGNMIFDIIMLPEKEFSGVVARLASAEPMGNPNLAPGRFIPAYSPRDRQVFTPPENGGDAAALAKAYFLKAFGL